MCWGVGGASAKLGRLDEPEMVTKFPSKEDGARLLWHLCSLCGTWEAGLKAELLETKGETYRGHQL